MPKFIGQVVLTTIMAALLVAATSTTTTLRAQTADQAPRADTSTAEKKSVRLPFRGKLHAVDKEGMTITLDGKAKKRVIHVTKETKIAKHGKTATLDDAVIGEEVGGQALRLPDGKEEALSLRFGPKPDSNKVPVAAADAP